MKIEVLKHDIMGRFLKIGNIEIGLNFYKYGFLFISLYVKLNDAFHILSFGFGFSKLPSFAIIWGLTGSLAIYRWEKSFSIPIHTVMTKEQIMKQWSKGGEKK